MKGLRTRHWACHSHGALAGKSTFLAATARTPMIVVDTDGRFEAVEGLANGPVYYPEQVFDPLDLAEEIIEMHGKYKPASIIWDSLTKLYSVHARLGYMRGRSGRKTADGKKINKASELIDKSNAMTIARDMAILGTDMYYVWHTTTGISGLGKSEVKDMISTIEKERLMTSVNVVLEFVVQDGNYGVTVVSARDFSGRKSNIGFTMWDYPGNYWSGAAERLEHLIYTSFASKEEAIKWGAEKLKLEIGEAEGVYDHLRESVTVKTSSQMWVAWIEHVDNLVKSKAPVEKKVSAPEEKVVAETVAQESETEEVTVPETDGETEVEETVLETESSHDGETNGEIEVEKKPVEKPAEGVAQPKIGEGEFSFNGELITMVRDKLKDKAGGPNSTITLGDIVDSAADAVAWKYPTPKDAMAVVNLFPGLPSSYQVKKSQETTVEGAIKIFDWLVFEA